MGEQPEGTLEESRAFAAEMDASLAERLKKAEGRPGVGGSDMGEPDGIEADSYWRHADGELYVVSDRCKFKNPETGEWVDCVAYREGSDSPTGTLYIRTVEGFLSRFMRARR